MTLQQREHLTSQQQTATRFIWVTFQREGIHQYPQALTDPQLAGVEFLGYPHRHMFHFKVALEVQHADREVEFILFKRWLTSLFDSGTLNFQGLSCEMISDQLYERIFDRYPGRQVRISVSEDGENGCEIYYGGSKATSQDFSI